MPQEISPLRGTKTLLIGDIGTGKTHALRTLVEAGLHPLCIFTEAGYGVLGDLPKGALSWIYVQPMKGSLDDLRKMVKDIGTKDQSALGKVYDANRFVDSPFDKVLEALFHFVDQNGRDFGNISTWTTKHVLVFDSLSGLTRAVWQNVAGTRALLDRPDYMLAQKQLENLIALVCTSQRCHVVMTAHAEKEIDPLNGGIRIYPSLPGKALAGTIGRDFDEVLLAEREGNKFTWTNYHSGAALKKRYLQYAVNQPPSFVPIIEAWKRQGGLIES